MTSNKHEPRLRRTMLFVPGNNPGMIQDAYIYKCDSIMIDLEDSVSLNEKDSARALVFQGLKTLCHGTKEIVVRINDPRTRTGLMDLETMIRAGVRVIRLPKTESADDIRFCDEQISRIEKTISLEPGSVSLLAAIESARGIMNCMEIASASSRLIGIALGAEDYVTDLRTKRTSTGIELLFARSMILHAARSNGIAALDTVFSNINDEEGLIRETTLIKELGFDGKSVIHPKQIEIINKIFTPSEKDVTNALAVIEALKEAKQKGSGVISLNGKMIDKPIVERARHILELANAAKLHY
ncbi:aldolase/citrate lyase family protein [uncultured Sphaerochaeta sp.]|uniref:aldolase/citrate lyase family protein n=1 Tax=uncultured Sphaerochaeta sp. TaxID=886478 RepID=UPI002A0A46B7|nr:aldolase/citrate lyase family protein [uncultured Sphaerochaeta sp.]